MRPTKRETRQLEEQIRADEDPLEAGNRVTPVMDEMTEEEGLEEEEQESGEQKDVLINTADTGEAERVLPDPEDIPEGMEGVARGQDADEFEKPGEDLETGEN